MPGLQRAHTRSPWPTSASVMSVAVERVLAPGAIRLYCVLSLRLTVERTPLSERRTICWVLRSSALTSPITPETDGVDCAAGDAVGVWALTVRLAVVATTTLIIRKNVLGTVLPDSPGKLT